MEAAGDWSRAIEILALYDSKRASNLPVNDWYRLRRYLEVSLTLLRLKKGDVEAGDGSAGPPVLTGIFIVTHSATHIIIYMLTHSLTYLLRYTRVITTWDRYSLFFLE